jgi:hypothetical protein
VSRGLISTVPRLPITTTRPELRQQRQVFPEVDVGEHLQDQVHALAARERHRLIEVALLVVVEEVVRALFGDELPARFGPRRADHDQAAPGAGE